MERGDRVSSSGEKLSLSLVLLVFMILHLLPGGRGTKSLPSGWVETATMPLAFFWTQSAYIKSRFGRGLPKIPSAVLIAPSPFCPVSYSCQPKLSCWDRWCFQLQFCRCLQRRAQPFKASCGKRAFSGLCISSMSSFPRTSVVHIDLLGRTAVQDQAVFWTPLGQVLDLFPVVIWDPLSLKTSQGY